MVKKIVLFACLFLSACVTTDTKSIRISEAVDDNLRLTMAYLSKNQVELAEQKLSIAKHLAPNAPEVLITEAYFFQSRGHEELARKKYEEALRASPNNPQVLNNYGAFLCEHHSVKEGLKYLQRVAQYPDYLGAEESEKNIKICQAMG